MPTEIPELDGDFVPARFVAVCFGYDVAGCKSLSYWPQPAATAKNNEELYRRDDLCTFRHLVEVDINCGKAALRRELRKLGIVPALSDDSGRPLTPAELEIEEQKRAKRHAAQAAWRARKREEKLKARRRELDARDARKRRTPREAAQGVLQGGGPIPAAIPGADHA